MKQSLVSPRWLLISFAILLVLAACERPIDRETAPELTEQSAPLSAPTSPATEPTLPAEPTLDSGGAEAPTPTIEPANGENPDATATPVPEENVETAPRGEITHIVVAGDTLFQLSLLYDVSVDAIVAANDLSDADTLDIGQALIIPATGAEPPSNDTGEEEATGTTGGEQTHTVQAGENLFRIGLLYGFTVDELAAYNNLANPDDLEVGQVIRIPPDE